VSEVFLKAGESVEAALRRLKDKVETEGTLEEFRRARAFETPTQKKRRKAKQLAQKRQRARQRNPRRPHSG
jgi:small subunit ribosomal protein S21